MAQRLAVCAVLNDRTLEGLPARVEWLRTNLGRRIGKLEKSVALTRDNRLVLRFVGATSEGMPQPTKEDMENGLEVFTVCFVAAKDGRPA
jgi:hypothetical protein